MGPASAGVARAVATAGIVVALDQATKQLVVESLRRGESVNVFLGLDITNTRNTGVAFGALRGGGLVVGLLIGISLAILVTSSPCTPTARCCGCRWGCCWAGRSATWPTVRARVP